MFLAREGNSGLGIEKTQNLRIAVKMSQRGAI